MLTPDTRITTQQPLLFHQEDPYDSEPAKSVICRTSDGRLHTVLAGEEEGWSHVVSSDGGATWTATEIESTTPTVSMTLATDGTGLLAAYYRGGWKLREYDGSAWGSEIESPFEPDSGLINLACTSDGAVHVVFQHQEIKE